MHVCNYLIVAIYNIFQKYTCPNPGRKLNILRFLIKKLLRNADFHGHVFKDFSSFFFKETFAYFPGIKGTSHSKIPN